MNFNIFTLLLLNIDRHNSGQMSSILGHSHPEICEVITDQMGRLDHLLSTFISEPVADLADLLTSLMPDALDKVGAS